jgi:hypothetical protein
MYEKLLENISKRLSSENALSDITWAFAETNEKFRHYFLNFFFTEFSLTEKILSFKREFTRQDSRPDFFIETENGEYIIESKIFDRNHHFEQYQISFPSAKFGYIANYKIAKRDNIQIKTWNEFYNYLQSIISNLSDEKEIIFLKSYNAFLKPVCFITNIKPMKLDTLSSLHSLNHIIRKVLNENEKLGEIEYDGKVRNIDDYRYGKYYGIKKNESEKKIWPWIGVYFNQDRVLLYIEINKEWCERAYEYLKQHPNLTDGNYFKKPYFDDDFRASYSFELKEEYFNNLNSMTESIKQEVLIKNFIDEVLEFIDSQY